MRLERLIFLIITAYGLALAGMERPEAAEPLFAIGLIAVACVATDPMRLRSLMTPIFAIKIVTGLAGLLTTLQHQSNGVALALPLGEVASGIAIGAIYSRLRWPEKAPVPARRIYERNYDRPITLVPTLQLELVRQETAQRMQQ